MRLFLAAIFALFPLTSATAETASFETCRASWDGHSLLIANSHIERIWQWNGDHLLATSFKDLDAHLEWLMPPKATTASTLTAPLTFTSKSGAMTTVEAPSLVIELRRSQTQSMRFQIFPNARGVLLEGIPDTLFLQPEHLQFTEVTLLDQTDVHNELVFERNWLLQRNEKPLRLTGNLFFTENTLTRDGIVFLKLGPLPAARPVHSEWDLEAAIRGKNTQFTFNQGEPDAAYPMIAVAYRGGRTGRTEALQSLQRQLRKFVPGRDGMFLSNTWGDRSRDARINADFMLKEVSAGAALGVDVIQIDDGWQTGRTANSARGKGVWNGFWADNPNFWQPDPIRFPQGLKPLVHSAAAKGMKFGLWYAPDSSNDFSNWGRDADRLLQLHREDGISYFKIDGVKATTRAGEQNLQRFFARVQRESQGKIAFDLDVTAETRPGYFGAPSTGPLFVENRYTDSQSYWPHQTLRNFWKLAAYVDPLRLRMEVLNNLRNQPLYGPDPLAPAAYTPDFLFATVMFANPLGWFETSNLSPEYAASMSKLVRTWKAHRERLFSDTILPIGDAPDGTSWTGFAAFDQTRKQGYLLIFRGVGAPPAWTTQLDAFDNANPAIELLAGQGSLVLSGGQLRADLPKSPGYAWFKVSEPVP